MTSTWQQHVGWQRDWVWRGWHIRYSYAYPSVHKSLQTPLLLLHGFGASIGHWRKNIEVWGRDRPVYALDLVGFGASRKPDIEYNAALWVEQVWDFWQTFIGVPTIVVGNSIGSTVAVSLLGKHPEAVGGLVMLNVADTSLEREMTPRVLHPIVDGLKKAIVAPWLLNPTFKFVKQPQRARKWAKLAYHNPEAVTDELMDIFLTPAAEAEAQTAFGRIIQGMTGSRFCPNLRQIVAASDIPILLVWGEEDRLIPRSVADRLIEANPRIDFKLLPNTGHCPHDEQPELVNQLVSQWLGKASASLTANSFHLN
jgi:pimeloyl-ACP methyl ester carboxylesterase